MTRTRTISFFLLPAVLLFSLAVTCPAAAQQYKPELYQPGKDVIWVPTPEGLVAAMLDDLAGVKLGDYVIDLGSGDGRIVIAAAQRGLRALGIEYNKYMVELSRTKAQEAGVADKASFRQADIFETDFSEATVLTMYLLSSLNMRLRPKILEMKPGTRVVSHAFTMEDWSPDRSATVEGRTAYLWIVPAQVAGTWTWQKDEENAELTLSQSFQKISGSMRIKGKELTLRDATLEGTRIQFAVGDKEEMRRYSGQVSGNIIRGVTTAARSGASNWTAVRHANQ